ncbi:hypothetical protein GmHk_13G037233 [Glycine max]|nr:hypothetical protein GmHk_13G037233 [Glycine max]
MITVLTGPVGTLPHQVFESRKHSQPIFSDFSRKLVRISRKTLSLKMAQAAQNPTRQQKVIITNKYGNKLVGILHESGTKEIVILCHGLRSTKEDDIIINLAAALENAGVNSFRFDFTGNGESEGSFEFGHYWREVDDLHDVVQHLHRENPKVIAIIGHSKGGSVVLLYASKHHDIKTVVNLSGRYDLKAGLEERLGKDYLERIRKDRFIDVMQLGNLSFNHTKVPWLLEHVEVFDYRVTMESLMDRLDTNMHEACLQIDKECRPCSYEPIETATAFQQQKFIIPNKYGYKLVGILHESGTKEIVLLCHGGRASKENFIMTNLAAALENAGISSFRFDFTGNGESEGSFEIGGFWREADDIHAVAQHFQEANRTVIAIVGHSKGANAALLYASKYHDIKTIVNLSGCHDLKVGLENRFGKDFLERLRKEGFIEFKAESGINYRVTEESLTDRLNIIMLEECLHIDKKCRFFTVHGSADIQIPVVAAHELAKILPNHKLHIIEGADHVYTDHQAELASVVLNFIKETLKLDKLNAS